METSLFIAKMIGPIYIVAGIGMLLNREFYKKFMQDFCNDYPLMLFSGFLALSLGIVIVLLHNTWELKWTVLITIFGWMGILKGVWLLVFPASVTSFMHTYRTNKALYLMHSMIALILGIVFTLLGYFVR